jgi:hypothetical protein
MVITLRSTERGSIVDKTHVLSKHDCNKESDVEINGWHKQDLLLETDMRNIVSSDLDTMDGLRTLCFLGGFASSIVDSFASFSSEMSSLSSISSWNSI